MVTSESLGKAGHDKSLTLCDIVIVNYNSTDYLIHCLDSIRHSLEGVSARILVEDNCSEDNVERIKTIFPEALLNKNSTNLGFAKAVNQAIRKGRSPYVVLLNPDTLVTEDFVKSLLEFMNANPDAGIMGPKILDADGSIQGSARSFPTPLTAIFGRTSFFSRLFPRNPITRRNILTTDADSKTATPVDWVSGACMIIRRKAIDQVGLMDERFFMYWEDADWCKRMWQAGWKVVYNPGIAITHHVGTSSKKNFVKSSFEFHRSAFNLYKKHVSKIHFYLVLPVLFGGLGLRFLLVLLREKKD